MFNSIQIIHVFCNEFKQMVKNAMVKHLYYTYVHIPSSLYSACIHDNKQFLRFFFRGKIYTSECEFVHTCAIFAEEYSV